MNLLGDRARLSLGYDLRFRLNLGFYFGLGFYLWLRLSRCLCWELGRRLLLGLGHKLT